MVPLLLVFTYIWQKDVAKISQMSRAPRPGQVSLGAFRAVHPQITACAPPNSNCAPSSENCPPKKVADTVPPESNSRSETTKILLKTPEFVSKNCFFSDFAIKTFFFTFIIEFVDIRAHFAIKPSFFFSVFTSEFVETRAYFAMKIFVFWSSLSNSKEKSFCPP